MHNNMKPKIYVLVGVPASGKSWVCSQLREQYHHLAHDEYARDAYVAALKSAAQGNRPILAEAPFNAADLVAKLRMSAIPTEQILVTAPLNTITARYYERNGKDYPANFRTNHGRYEADSSRFWFSGTSSQVVDKLKGLL